MMSNDHATSSLSDNELYWRARCALGYHGFRRFVVRERLTKVAGLLKKFGTHRGYQSRVAEMLGVSRATICRDMTRLRRLPGESDEVKQTAHAAIHLDARGECEARDVDGRHDHSPPATAPVREQVAPSTPVSKPSVPVRQTPRWLPVRRRRTQRYPWVSPSAGVPWQVRRW
jgi:hypothetical protein